MFSVFRLKSLFFFIIAATDIPNIAVHGKWAQNGITVAGGNGAGNGLNQLANPYSVCVDDDQTIYVAEWSNHRVVEWKIGATSGQVVAGRNGEGNRNDQLSHPLNVIIDKEGDSLIISDYRNQRVMRWPRRNGTSGQVIISNIASWGLAMDNAGYLYVSDHDKHEVRRWKIGDTSGTLVAGGNGQGNLLDQLNSPTNIFIDQDQTVYVCDLHNHRVMKWMKGTKEGIVVAGGQGAGNGLTQLHSPYGVVVDQLDSVYVTEYGNSLVSRWCQGASEGSVVVGGHGSGGQANQLFNPVDLCFDGQGNLYVADQSNHRVQKFNIESNSNT